MTTPLIAIIDDEKDVQEAICSYLLHLRIPQENIVFLDIGLPFIELGTRNIDILITDYLMPKKTGDIVIQELSRIFDLKFIFMFSAFSPMILEHSKKIEFPTEKIIFIEKPDTRSLAAKVVSCFLSIGGELSPNNIL